MKKLIITLIIMLLSSQVGAAVVWEENFDDIPDWSPTQLTGGQSNNTTSTDPSDPDPPIGFDYYTIDGSAYTDKLNNTLTIDNTNYYGASGKALTFYSEQDNNCGAWCNDGLLGIQLPGGTTGYNEIYIRFVVKFQPNWNWKTQADIGHKILHVAHHRPTDSLNEFFEVDENKPRAFHKIYWINNLLGGSSTVWAQPTVSRYDGSTNPDFSEGSIYYPGGDYGGDGSDMTDNQTTYVAYMTAELGATYEIVTSPYTPTQVQNFPTGMFGDGGWHFWQWRLKMNSAEGVADGIFEFWQDGIKLYSYTNIDWVQSGGGNPADRQWNYIWIGGNNNNTYNPSSEVEQWYAVDDVVVSTTWIDPDYTIGSGTVVSITASDTSASEVGPATGSVTVSCTGDDCATSSVEYALTGSATDTTDYNDDGSGTISTFPTTITFTPIGDEDCEGSETITFSLQNPTNCSIGSLYTEDISIANDPADCVSSGSGPTSVYNSAGAKDIWNSSGYKKVTN